MPTSTNVPARHLAVVPARGGSKRLPRKNIADFFGRPMIVHSIEAGRESDLFDRLIASTEDKEIARVAAEAGAEVDLRPVRLAADEATVADVCAELLDRLDGQGERFDTLTVLYATAPLRTAADIRGTFELLAPGRCEFSMAVTAFRQPLAQALRTGTDGTLSLVFPNLVKLRADEAGAFVVGNGSTYCASVEAFRREHDFYGDLMRGYLMPPERSVDIDTAADLALARHYGGLLGFRPPK